MAERSCSVMVHNLNTRVPSPDISSVVFGAFFLRVDFVFGGWFLMRAEGPRPPTGVWRVNCGGTGGGRRLRPSVTLAAR